MKNTDQILDNIPISPSMQSKIEIFAYFAGYFIPQPVLGSMASDISGSAKQKRQYLPGKHWRVIQSAEIYFSN
ncbi:MAG: hypothetical protein JXR97_06815 [Planctomycetes bacterium]|nr:hypothetical protein [Planctomycetota bacterium]